MQSEMLTESHLMVEVGLGLSMQMRTSEMTVEEKVKGEEVKIETEIRGEEECLMEGTEEPTIDW